jgi:hypothetical protein
MIFWYFPNINIFYQNGDYVKYYFFKEYFEYKFCNHLIFFD